MSQSKHDAILNIDDGSCKVCGHRFSDRTYHITKCDKTGCHEDAEFKVKMGQMWGRYCGDDILAYMRSGNWTADEQPIYPVDEEVSFKAQRDYVEET